MFIGIPGRQNPRGARLRQGAGPRVGCPWLQPLVQHTAYGLQQAKGGDALGATWD